MIDCLTGLGIRTLGHVVFEGTAPGQAPMARRFPDNAPKPTREVRLIAHTAAQGDRTQRLKRRQHQSLGRLNAPAREIAVCGHTEGGFERAAEMSHAEAEQSGQVLDADLFCEFGINVRGEPPRLPRGEAASHDLLLLSRRCTYVR